MAGTACTKPVQNQGRLNPSTERRDSESTSLPEEQLMVTGGGKAALALSDSPTLRYIQGDSVGIKSREHMKMAGKSDEALERNWKEVNRVGFI